MTEDEKAQVENWFTYHPPTEADRENYVKIRDKAKELACVVFESCPPSADRTAALRKIREAVMTANASIACGGK